VILSSSDVGLGNVDNTSDVNKPISTATQTAINGKASASHAHGNLTNAGAIGTTSGQIVVTTTGGVVTAASSISSSAVSGLATVATSGSYADLSNKPATFTPSSHTHTASAITDFSSAVDAKLTTQTANVSFAGITMYDGPGSGGGMFIGYQQILGIASLSFNSGGTQTTAWTGSIAISGVTGLQAALDGKQASGNYATLVGGTVPSSQLPSYVDDVLEFASVGAFPATGESGKIFVATGTGKIYRWSGSTYIEISPSPGSTDSISEGSVNLYHTTARAAAAAPVQSVAGRTGAVTIAAADVSGLGSLATQSSVSYSALTDKPATFAPSSHTHTASAITDFDSAVASASPAEVLEYTTSASFPATGSTGKIYVATDSSRAYRWTGAAYAEVGPAGAYLPTHTHAASDIVSGTLASARLPSATTSTAGAVTVGTGLAVSSGTISAEVIGRYLPGYDGIADADDWASRVATAGGSVSTDTMTAVYKFCISIAAAGVRDRFYRLNLFCGSNLTTALVPLYRGLSRSGTQYGNTTDTNYNFLSGDYSESTGLIGNGSNKYLDTGFNVSTLTLASRHLSFYENQKATVQWSTPIGVTGTSYYFRYDWETASGATYGTYGAYLDSSAASSCKDAYYAQAGAHFIATNTAALLWNMYKGGWDVKGVVYGLSNTTANPSATLTVFCNRNGASGTNQFWNGRLVAYSVGLGMTGAAAVAYSAALQEFNRSLGRAA